MEVYPMARRNKEQSAAEAAEVKAAEGEFEFDAASVDEVMRKYDRDSNTRIWEGWQKWVVYGILAAFALFVIYVTLFATWLDLVRYPSFLGCVLFCGYLIYPSHKGRQKVNYIPWYDWLLMILGAGAFFYYAANAHTILNMRLAVRMKDIKYTVQSPNPREVFNLNVKVWTIMVIYETL